MKNQILNAETAARLWRRASRMIGGPGGLHATLLAGDLLAEVALYPQLEKDLGHARRLRDSLRDCFRYARRAGMLIGWRRVVSLRAAGSHAC